MKVRRQNLTEEYNTTADWVRDFSNGLSKNADYLSNLRSIMKKRKDFDTIEEKMADLKSRVGFDLVKNINAVEPSSIKEAGCGCNSCDTCGTEVGSSSSGDSDKKMLAEQVKRTLQYISSFAKDRPEAGYGAVITHCREHPQLGFDKLEQRLNHKFKEAVHSILNKHKKDPEAVEYISGADMASSHDDDVADYYSHANG
tara:strand:+ start:71 stop:667 length:597 start_codon:yes stop_codon:yes gene_type:complete